jgi:hypothetical protein
MNRIHLTKDSDRWRALVNRTVNLGFRRETSCASSETSSFSRRTSVHKVSSSNISDSQTADSVTDSVSGFLMSL